MTLTEQLAKESLPEYTEFYVRKKDGSTDTQTWLNRRHSSAVEWWNTFNITEVLAPVPSYEEYNRLKEVERKKGKLVNVNYKIKQENQQLHKFLEEFNALDVAEENEALKTKLSIQCEANEELRKENQRLKELLKECQYMIFAYSINHDTFTKEKVLDTVKQIDNAIGEKK